MDSPSNTEPSRAFRLARPSTWNRRGILWGLIIGAVAGQVAYLARPVPLETEVARPLFVDLLNSLRPGNIELWKEHKTGGVRSFNYASMRIALLVSGKFEFSIPAPSGDKPVALSLGKIDHTATAVVIAPDGYLLTGSHCVSVEPISLVIKDLKTSSLRRVEARVVWKGDYQSGAGPDLAVIHVPGTFDLVFPFEGGHGIQPGTPVMSIGFGSGSEALIGGQCIRVSEDKPVGGPRKFWRELQHDAPYMPGDSGGALFDESGTLLGINARLSGAAYRWMGHHFVWRWHGVAIVPDQVWLQEVLEEDRRKRAGK